MAEEAQVVFCPYSYVINPVVRRAMDVDIKGSILIIDEAQYVVLFSLLLFLSSGLHDKPTYQNCVCADA